MPSAVLASCRHGLGLPLEERSSEGGVLRLRAGPEFFDAGWGNRQESIRAAVLGLKAVPRFGKLGARYSVAEMGDCGLPAARASLTSLRTGWRWKSNGNDAGQYNAAYDIWLGTETMFQTYFMVWLRDPTNFQPAGDDPIEHVGITVANVPGVWTIRSGQVNSRPIVNYVRAEGMDSTEIEFDVLDFIADAEARGYSIPTHVRAVAVGFEIWEGPIAGLTSEDFYVEVE